MKKILTCLLAVAMLSITIVSFADTLDKINATYWCAWGGNMSYSLGPGNPPSALPDVKYLKSVTNGKVSKNDKGLPVILTDAVSLDKIPEVYNIIVVAFVVEYEGNFVLQNFALVGQEKKKVDGPYTYDDIKNFIKAAHAKGQKVTAAIGGATFTTPITKDNAAKFSSDLSDIIEEFGFDGIDLDFENWGTLQSDAVVVGNILKNLRTKYGSDFILSMVPEYPTLIKSNIYGKLLAQGIDFTYVGIQYYNQYGAGVNTDDTLFDTYYMSATSAMKDNKLPLFVAAVTWAFATKEGNDKNYDYCSVPANKIVIGLPAAVGAAGNMSTTPADRLAFYDKVTEILIKAGIPASQAKIGGFLNWSADFDNLITTGDDPKGFFNHPQWSFGKSIADILDDKSSSL